MDTPKVLFVQPLSNKKLLLKFSNEVEKTYDCKPLIEKHDMFKPLENEAFFKQVKVDAGGYGISWSDKLDLSEYELWTNAVEVVPA
ncbi:MAG: DUF2442 domain-containing protein [Chloroflexi bacterium]|nr:DUF2442 domain-containing protein [Chloroflexota bacterium]